MSFLHILNKNIGLFTRINKTSILKGENYIGKFSQLNNTQLGYASYMGSSCKFVDTIIGNYTSIASNVRVVYGQHPTQTFVSTHPAFYTNKNKNLISFVDTVKFKEYKHIKDTNVKVIIGNDVWIGDSVLIMEGVHIADGTIVATGSIVTKSTQPYSIVAGTPAKKIGQRFSDETIKKLKDLRWWDKKIEWIKNHADYFSNVNSFFEVLENE